MRRHSSFIGILGLSLGLAATSLQADNAASDELAAVTANMTSIAQAFIATLESPPSGIENSVGYNRRELSLLASDDAARTNFVYWPYLRKGLPIDFMTAPQRLLVHDLLNTALSAKGYLSAVQIMQMEKILADAEVTGFPRGTENYTLAFFGTPA